jgi:hypothetical protein
MANLTDPRYTNNGTVYRGAPMTRQQALNRRQVEYVHNHPLSFGWELLRKDTTHSLWVYHQSGVELMRCPKGDGWLIRYLGERRRVRCHVSELTAKLECAKRAIEAQLSKQFAATLAA